MKNKKKTGKAKRLDKTLHEKRTKLGVFNNLFQELLETDDPRMGQMHFNFLAKRLYSYLLREEYYNESECKAWR